MNIINYKGAITCTFQTEIEEERRVRVVSRRMKQTMKSQRGRAVEGWMEKRLLGEGGIKR